MGYLASTFRAVSITFAVSAVGTGIQALVSPVGFSRFFGLPLPTPSSSPPSSNPGAGRSSKRASKQQQQDHALTESYVSLMGVRQLATGITLLAFSYQRKWDEVATILSILGFVVAGTDGVYIARGNDVKAGLFHAIPGSLISVLAGAYLYIGK